MSYDLEVWSINPVPFSEALPEFERWDGSGDGWEFSEDDWHIVVDSGKALSEDAPDEIVDLLPGKVYLTILNLEGVASDRAIVLINETGRNITKASQGILIDPQEGRYFSHDGVDLDLPKVTFEKFALLHFTWLFNDSPLWSHDGFSAFLKVLEQTLPEAMPRRYGNSQPPKYQFSVAQRDHFVEFAWNEINSDFGYVVWYPTKPVMYVWLGLSPGWGPHKLGFRANCVTFGIDAAVLTDAGWSSRLDSFWRNLSRMIQPFYGDVRTLHNYLRARSDILTGNDTEKHPVKSWWWNGIPRTLGHAVVLGEPYLSLWPKFCKAATISGGLAFLATADWTSKQDVSKLVGGVPAAIRQGSNPLNGFSRRWPFEGPFAS